MLVAVGCLAGGVGMLLAAACGRGGAPASPPPAPAPGRPPPAAGDLDGDGFADLVVGAPTAGEGRVYVWRGGERGVAAAPVAIDAPEGARAFGWSVASGADLDGDGFVDLAVGAWGASRVYVYRGGAAGVSGPPIASVPAEAAPSEHDGTFYGWAIASTDLDLDGWGDLIVGEPGAARSRGRVHVFRGPALSFVTSVEGDEGASLGWSVSAAAAKVVIGAPGREEIWIYDRFGPEVGTTRASPRRRAFAIDSLPRPEAASPRIWSATELPGGAWIISGTGWAALARPGEAAPLWAWVSPDPTDRVSIAGGGDLDGDGIADLVVGVDRGFARAGEVRVHFARPQGDRCDAGRPYELLPEPDLVLASPDGDAGSFGASVAISGPTARCP